VLLESAAAPPPPPSPLPTSTYVDIKDVEIDWDYVDEEGKRKRMTKSVAKSGRVERLVHRLLTVTVWARSSQPSSHCRRQRFPPIRCHPRHDIQDRTFATSGRERQPLGVAIFGTPLPRIHREVQALGEQGGRWPASSAAKLAEGDQPPGDGKRRRDRPREDARVGC
jgi:hypothetical protein